MSHWQARDLPSDPAAALEAVLDIAALLDPLEAEAPCGPSLRHDPIYRAIAEARRADNAALPRGVWVRDIKRADWPEVERLSREALAERSKDLQIACWLCEALIHRAGFAGLAAGLQLITLLCERFWPALHPLPEEGDLDTRLAPFDWLNTRLPPLLRDQPLVASPNAPEKMYTWAVYANALLLDSLRQRDAASVARSEKAGAVTIAAFNAMRDQTPTAFWTQRLIELRASTEALSQLNATLTQLCAEAAPGLGAIAGTLRDIIGLLAPAWSDRQPRPFATPPHSMARAAKAGTQPIMVPPRSQSAVQHAGAEAGLAAAERVMISREQGYVQLAELANALHALEPHSPSPYLVKCAVAWADLSFGEVMARFTRAGLDISKVFEVLGLSPSNGDT